MHIKLRSIALGGLALALISLVACGSPPAPSSDAAVTGGGNRETDVALYRGVLQRVKSSYVEPVEQDKLITNSLKGMLNGLDPHSDYMTESEYQDMLDDSQGEFAGIGAELTRDDNRPKVIAPIDDTPAAHAGIHAGDYILKIDGKSTEGMSLRDVVNQLRGPVGTPVVINIGRANTRPFDVSLTRAIIRVASVKWRLEPDHVGYAQIASFGEKTQQELLAAIDAMKHEAGGNLTGFVLDLRNDPGGLLDEAVHVSADFLDGGTVVSTHGRDADDERVYRAAPDGDRLKGVPVIVLINGASASASEIVAGALQDHHRAVLMGTRSFGKGSVQTIIPLDGRGALRLTTARYYTPSGRSIQAEGIVPDRIVRAPKDQLSVDAEVLHEADLRGALDTQKKAAAAKTATAANAKSASDDEGSIDPAVIGTTRDSQLAAALAEVHAMGRRPVAGTQSPDAR